VARGGGDVRARGGVVAIGAGVPLATASGRLESVGASGVLKLNSRTSPRTVATIVATARRGGSARGAGLGVASA
jgi:hypothetical protein